MTKKIPLLHGQVTLVDEDDYVLLKGYKWRAGNNRGYGWYVQRTSPTDGNGKEHTLLMHREILNAKPDEEIDHIDGDGLNNQKSNLRLCTRSQNMANSRKGEGYSSRFKGVWWNRRLGEWQVAIRVSGRRIHLGLFENEKEAARAYNAAAIEAFGEFARINEDVT